MSSLAPELAQELLPSVELALQTFLVDARRFPTAEGRARYNPVDFTLLRELDRTPGCRATDISERTGVPPTTLQSSIDRLVRAGLVRKDPHPDSARARALKLTEEGEDLRAAIHRQDLRNMEAVLAGLEPEERRAFVRLAAKAAAGLAGAGTGAGSGAGTGSGLTEG